MKQNLILARHGSTHNNGDKLERGWGDIPLSQEGLDEVKVLAESLKDKNLYGIYTSDLKRALRTSQIISETVGIPILKETMTLRTWNVGDIEGMEEKAARLVEMQYVKMPDVKTPNGESFNTFKNRILTAFRDIVSENPNRKIVFVLHHQAERIIKAWIKMGLNPDCIIDVPTFFDKGAPPATYEEITVDTDKLTSLMHRLMLPK